MGKRVRLLGFDIDTYTFEEAINVAKNISGHVVTINPEIMSNPNMIDIVNSAQLVIPDGIGVQLGLLIVGHKVKRIPGIQFAYRMLEECSKNNESVALIGAKPEIISKTVENLNKEIKNLNIVYSHDGYFTNEEDIINNLKEKNPRLVLCALGSPKQDLFIKEALKSLPNSLFVGVGGSFDVWSGNVKRAPLIWQNLGLEWFYRTIKEPKRLKRIFPTLPLFVFRVLKNGESK